MWVLDFENVRRFEKFEVFVRGRRQVRRGEEEER